MYSDIIVPVSLAHLDQIGKALEVAADLARHYRAKVHYVGVTTTLPSEVAHNPAEFADHLLGSHGSYIASHSKLSVFVVR